MRRRVFHLLITMMVGLSGFLVSVGVTVAGQPADHIDVNRYPNVHQFFSAINLNVFKEGPVSEANRWWCPAEDYIAPPQGAIAVFLRAAVRDELTAIRWLALMSKVLHAEGLAMCTSGDVLNAAIESLNLDLGLALPLRELGAFAWLPQYDPEDPTRLMRLNLIYRKQYIHRFRKEILPVDLKIGYGETVRFIDHGIEQNGYLTYMDFYVSEDRIGFDNIKGLAGRRQGFLGLLQRILFFLPDDVVGMYVENNALVAKALITMRVPNFETTPKYQMRIRDQKLKVP
ncbi:MAG TPA: hypothetical protein EYN18_05360 [Nitrospirales bacterium]|nr:hypothetical protein [Nitrospirales bacterium]